VGDGAADLSKRLNPDARSLMPETEVGAEFMSPEWNTYRTRFLIRAKQLTEPLAFTDALGRDHCGAPGDYLVESSEGVLRIAPRAIFEDIYVQMEDQEVDCPRTLEQPRSGPGIQPAA
jgi:hypothetical protein